MISSKSHTIFLGLGANVGDKKGNLDKAIDLLAAQISDIKVSKYYKTKPVGYTKQDNFLNAAVSGTTTLSPIELLKFVKDIEQKVGRIKRFRWGPREIDIDVLFYDNEVFKSEQLTLPHPEISKRDFVLKPLLDLDPDFEHPVLKNTIQQLYDVISEDDKSVIT